jgi:hypothetical protein
VVYLLPSPQVVYVLLLSPQDESSRENIRQELNWQVVYGRRKWELVQVAAEH